MKYFCFKIGLFLILILALFATTAGAQSGCEKVKLYDQMIVKGDQPGFQKLKKFDKKLIPDSTFLQIKNEVIKYTSPAFFATLNISSVKLFDSSVATAWSWTHPPITDKNSNPVYFFYSVVFETIIDKTPFAFRVDFLKNGELLNEGQISFLEKGKLHIRECKEIVTLVFKDAIQPIRSIDQIYLAYSPIQQAVIWTVESPVDSKTGIQFYKDIDALTGEIIRRSFSDLNAVPQVEELEAKPSNN